MKRDSQTRSPTEPTGQQSKRVKTEHDSTILGECRGRKIEFEDISEEVDARLKEKEEKRRQKEKKKRKRISDGASGADAESMGRIVLSERPKKKKRKSGRSEGEAAIARNEPIKRRGSSSDETANRGERKKKVKKSEESI